MPGIFIGNNKFCSRFLLLWYFYFIFLNWVRMRRIIYSNNQILMIEILGWLFKLFTILGIFIILLLRLLVFYSVLLVYRWFGLFLLWMRKNIVWGLRLWLSLSFGLFLIFLLIVFICASINLFLILNCRLHSNKILIQ